MIIYDKGLLYLNRSIYSELKGSKKHVIFLLITAVIAALIGYTMTCGLFSKRSATLLSENAFFVPDKPITKPGTAHLYKALCFGIEVSTYKEETVILKDSVTDKNLPGEQSSTDTPLPEESDSEKYNPKLLPILTCDISSKNVLALNNTTSKRPNVKKLLMADYDFGYDINSTEPLVLIIHTHATECYSRENSTYYDETSATRTEDKNNNMIAVGKVLAETLNNSGIVALHSETMHDAGSYRDAYSLSAATIKSYLEEYPSIRYVLDLHRDAIMYESGAKARPITEVNGRKAAQMMILVGTDAGGADFPDWETNLSLALKLCEKIGTTSDTLMRSTAIRGASYNEQYTTGSLLIEVGSDGNTLSEAKYSAELLGYALADLIKGN